LLNYVPTSISITHNEFSGEISYTVSYNTRPLNFFSGVASENITITDTYPGDIYSIIPVLNRLNGPILNYIGGRTEYQRNLNIELTVNRSNINYNSSSAKNTFIYSKPSMNPLIQNQLKNIILQCSPALEPNIRKYFLSPVSENWDPISGKYSTQISWTYELNT